MENNNILLTDKRVSAILLFSLFIIVAVILFVDRVPQDSNYFQFADARNIFGVNNFLNVASNAAFLLPGIAGLWFLRAPATTGVLPGTRTMYVVLFSGVVLTAFGSSWFHLSPNNETLVWDRLPMTLVFMSLTATIVAEYVSLAVGRRFFLPLLAVGASSVAYWAWTEANGAGDLRAYGLVQFLPMIIVPVIALSFQSRFDKRGFLLRIFILYAIAKIAELYDRQIFAVGEYVSGHTLKHLIAALALLALLRGVKSRRVRS
jgi:hypothetical protein